jgi:hypothetical protein
VPVEEYVIFSQVPETLIPSAVRVPFKETVSSYPGSPDVYVEEIEFPDWTRVTWLVMPDVVWCMVQSPAQTKGASEGGWVGAGVGVASIVAVGAGEARWVMEGSEAAVSDEMSDVTPVPIQAMATSTGMRSMAGASLREIMVYLHIYQ